jgi:glutaredoxin
MLFVALAGVLVMGAAAAYRLQSIRASNQPTAAAVRTEVPAAVAPTPAATAMSTDTETQVAISNPIDTYRWQEPIHALPNSVPMASSHLASPPTPSVVIETAPQPAPEPSVQRAMPADVHVVVYTTSWCPHCREAKAWMASRGISYEERDIEASTDNGVMLKEINPRGGVPTFDVDGDVMVGFSAGSLASLLQHAHARQAARSL